MKANDKQVGGTHYRTPIQHWDWAAAAELDYFQGQITKYVARWKNKNGLQDLLKAQHFLEKYIEVVKAEGPIEQDPEVTYMNSLAKCQQEPDDGSAPGPGYVNQG